MATPALQLLTYGGTIAMAPSPSGVYLPVPATRIAELVAELARGATGRRTVTHTELADIDSGHTRPRDWAALADSVRTAAPGPALVTYGTDTMSWAAAALAAAGCGLDRTVVLTGAHIPLGLDGSDAPNNLRAALAAADALPHGVWVVFAGTTDGPASVIQGGFARKLHAHGASFVDVAGQPFASVAGGHLVQHATVRPHPTAPTARFDRPVELVRCWPGVTVDPAPPAPACVVETYACGTVPPHVAEAAASWVTHGAHVTAVPPTPIDATFYPSTGWLTDAGVHVELGWTAELAVCLAAAGDGDGAPT